MNEDQEAWRSVPDYPEIVVSNFGRVKRVAYLAKDGKLRRERVLRPQRGYGEALRRLSGYIRVKRGRQTHDICLADLVCAAWFPEWDADFYQPAFVNGDKADCSVRNIILIPKFAARLAKRLGAEQHEKNPAFQAGINNIWENTHDISRH